MLNYQVNYHSQTILRSLSNKRSLCKHREVSRTAHGRGCCPSISTFHLRLYQSLKWTLQPPPGSLDEPPLRSTPLSLPPSFTLFHRPLSSPSCILSVSLNLEEKPCTGVSHWLHTLAAHHHFCLQQETLVHPRLLLVWFQVTLLTQRIRR